MSRVLIAAGGTGGHVYPALATADVLRGRGHDVSFVGGDRIEARLVPSSGYELHRIPARSLPRTISPRAILAGLAFARAYGSVRKVVRSVDVVLGMGGYPSLAPSLRAGRLGVPLVLHEQNAVLSLSNRLSARYARSVALSLPLRLEHPRVELVGNPLRAPIREAARDPAARETAANEARRRWKLEEGKLTVLVFGGSLGAVPLNDGVTSSSPRWMSPAVQVLHVTGPANEEAVRRAWGDVPVRVVPYVDAMQDALAVSDLAVTRAGASTVAELTAFGLPSVLVPLPHAAGGAQDANARVLEAAGASLVVAQGAGFDERLPEAIGGLVADPGRRRTMRSAALELARPDAAERLADVVERALS